MTDYLTTAQAAELLGVTDGRVRQIVDYLQGSKAPDGSLRFPVERVQAVAAERGNSHPRPGPQTQTDLLAALLCEVRALRADVAACRESLSRLDDSPSGEGPTGTA